MKTDLKWSLIAFALSWLVGFKLLLTFTVGMPRFSVLFCLMKDQIVLDLLSNFLQ